MARAVLDASGLSYRDLNSRVRELARDHCVIELRSVNGQRFLGTGLESTCTIEVHGTPGQDLGAFLAGPDISVFGNAQDGVGNTMGLGRIVIHGCAGHVLALSARGGRVFVADDVGPRAAIHMKSNGSVMPIVVIGGSAGPFLGEYMSGGIVVVLNASTGKAGRRRWPRAGTVAAGIHGGTIFVRGAVDKKAIWDGALVEWPSKGEMALLEGILREYCECFNGRFDIDSLFKDEYTVIKPRSHKPYSGQYWHEG